MKISAKNIEVILCLFANPRQCMQQVSGNTLQQVETFKYLRVVFTCVGRRSPRRLIHGLVKLTQFCVNFISVATKREISNTVKLSVFKSIFVPILTYGHKSWVTPERILTQVQAPKFGFLRRVHGETKWRTEVRLHPGQETALSPPYLNLSYFWIKCPALKKKLAALLRLFVGAK